MIYGAGVLSCFSKELIAETSWWFAKISQDRSLLTFLAFVSQFLTFFSQMVEFLNVASPLTIDELYWCWFY